MAADKAPVSAPSIAEALVFGRRLIDAVDARLLLRDALQCTATRLAAYPEARLDADQWTRYQTLVSRREEGEPVAYLLGCKEFYGRSFKVTPAVLIPRPETELLVELCLRTVGQADRPGVLDLGTGSGAIAVTLALELTRCGGEVCGVDASAAALEVARDNALSLGAWVEFRHGSWYSPVDHERFDCIVSNPPYIREDDRHLGEGDVRFEPSSALSSGADGLDDLRQIVRGAAAHLKPGGWLYVEHGYDQAGAVGELFRQAGFAGVCAWPDLAGILRVSGGRIASS